MNKLKHTILLISPLMLVIILHSITIVNGATNDELRTELNQTYINVLKAEAAGGNVTQLVDELNQCESLIEKGGSNNLENAQILLNKLNTETPIVESQGIQSKTNRYLTTGISLSVLAGGSILIWLYGSKVFWILWLRTKRNWKIETL